MADSAQKPRNHTRFSFSIRAKLLVAFIGLALGPMVLLAGWMFWRAEAVLRHQVQAELEVEVATAAQAIEAQLEGIGREVLSLERFLSRRLSPYMTEQQWQTVEEEFLNTLEQGPFYFQVRYIGVDGMENIRVNNQNNQLTLVPSDKLQYKGSRYYFQEALATDVGQVYISALDYNMEHGRIEEPPRLVVRLGTPVRNRVGQKRGVVILNVFGADLLDPLTRLETGQDGRVLLLSEDQRFIEMQRDQGGYRFQVGTREDRPVLTQGAEWPLMAEKEIRIAPQRSWRLVKILPQSRVRSALIEGQKTTLWLVLPLTALAALLATAAARTFSRPIRKLSDFAAAVEQGEFSRRTAITSRDELGQLGHSLNQMAIALEQSHQQLQRWNIDLQQEVAQQVDALKASQAEAEGSRKALIRLEKQLLQADRLASLGMLAATIAHEVGNPLAGLKLRLQMLERKMSPEQAKAADVGRLLEMVDRLSGFVDHLTGYISNSQARVPGPVDLVRVLRELEFILREETDRKQLRFTLTLPDEPVQVCSQGQHLHQIFMNLILNAIQAAPAKGWVEVALTVVSGQVQAQIRDNGLGLSAEVQKQAFEPLFTTKEKGTGLGLPIVQQLINELGGHFSLETHPEGGAVACLTLPHKEGACPDDC